VSYAFRIIRPELCLCLEDEHAVRLAPGPEHPVQVRVQFVHFARASVRICAGSSRRSQSSCLGLDLPLPIILRIKFNLTNVNYICSEYIAT
jgi:hypothetical protein